MNNFEQEIKEPFIKIHKVHKDGNKTGAKICVGTAKMYVYEL